MLVVAVNPCDKEFLRYSVRMIIRKTDDSLDLANEDQEFRRFFQRLRQSGRLVVKDGDDEFVVEVRRASLTPEARRRLTGGGPEA